MSKNFLFAAIACAALLASGCDKTDNPTSDKVSTADFVGTWNAGESNIVFSENGNYTEKQWQETYSGKWSFNETDNTITFTPSSGDVRTVKVLLIGGKAWLVFIEEFNGMKSCESYRKAGAKVESAPLGDGRWDATHDGVKPVEYTADADYRLCFLISGKNIDLYVPMWGYHIQGTFTFNDGKLHIATDDNHIWAGKEINVVDSSNWHFGWQAWGDGPDDGPSMNPETFELNGYTWYTVNDLKKMGHKPESETDLSFEAAIWNAAQQLHDEAMDLCDIEICVTPDGKEAYGNAGGMGLPLCCYKR